MTKIKLTQKQIRFREAIKTGRCPYCRKTHRFHYIDQASTYIKVENGTVSYGNDTHSGEVEEVRCDYCDEIIPQEIWLNWEW